MVLSCISDDVIKYSKVKTSKYLSCKIDSESKTETKILSSELNQTLDKTSLYSDFAAKETLAHFQTNSQGLSSCKVKFKSKNLSLKMDKTFSLILQKFSWSLFSHAKVIIILLLSKLVFFILFIESNIISKGSWYVGIITQWKISSFLKFDFLIFST